jgi:hypothetical protein
LSAVAETRIPETARATSAGREDEHARPGMVVRLTAAAGALGVSRDLLIITL